MNEVERIKVTYGATVLAETNIIGGFPEHFPGVVRGVILGYTLCGGCVDLEGEVTAITPGAPTASDPLYGVTIVMRSRDGVRVSVPATDIGVWEVQGGWIDDFAFDPCDDECELCGFPRFDCQCD